ncbi:hypothetical protein SNE40_017429 [Patella caerulea]|uniref:Fucosyltransferase n=1 Tax=Patella caerulea TaxID=87958 RepID=A0AAN8PLQ1_PATCE
MWVCFRLKPSAYRKFIVVLVGVIVILAAFYRVPGPWFDNHHQYLNGSDQYLRGSDQYLRDRVFSRVLGPKFDNHHQYLNGSDQYLRGSDQYLRGSDQYLRDRVLYDTDLSEYIHAYNYKLPSEYHTDASYKERKILLWYVPPRYVNSTPHLQPLTACPDRNCFTTTNTAYMKDAAAVLFNAQIMQIQKPMPRPKSQQIWILHDTEPEKPDWSHSVTFRTPPWWNLFNWTMFYREDSDIFASYGIVRRKLPSELYNRDLDAIVKAKPKKFVALISHCGTEGKRLEYIQLLQKHIQIDIYGGCGPLKWSRSDDKGFMHMVNSTYKFYLAFENSFCDDYISEKAYRYYKADFILVVRGGGNYTRHIPAGTFIDTRDFKTTKDLADHLRFLDTNHDAYMKMFRKKDLYTSETEALKTVHGNTVVWIHYQFESRALCEVCYRLNHLQKYSKTIERIDKWFDKRLCYFPDDLK